MRRSLDDPIKVKLLPNGKAFLDSMGVSYFADRFDFTQMSFNQLIQLYSRLDSLSILNEIPEGVKNSPLVENHFYVTEGDPNGT